MSKKHSKLNGATAFTIIASILFLLVAPLTSQAADCHPDQIQLQTQGAIGLGGRTVVSQTFIPSAPGQRVCRVKVFITKNAIGAGPLTLHLLGFNFAELDGAVTIPGFLIPMGNSIQVFEFGCNGVALAGMPFYGLKLESPGSAFGAYSWRGIGGNVYAKPGNGGMAWRNVKAGVGPWTNLGAFDYAFEIYMCN